MAQAEEPGERRESKSNENRYDGIELHLIRA
jgi:hypothetical protein